MPLFDDVELALKYFYDTFNFFINKHPPLRKFRVKGRNNPWFTAELSSLIVTDMVIYCSSSSVSQSLKLLQSAFDTVQSRLTRLKLVLNAEKSKAMLFSNDKQLPPLLPSLSTVQGVEIETVRCYKYFGILINENQSFKPHIDKLVSKLKLKLGFLLWKKKKSVSHTKSGNI